MLFALGAASSALDAIKSLTSTSSAQPAGGFGQSPFDISGSDQASASATPAPTSTGFSQISPATMSALLAAQGEAGSTTSAPASPADALKDLFSQIDGNGDGQISKSEFESALGAGGTNIAQADDVFGKLDTNGDGTVSLDELSSALKGAGGKGHHHAYAAGSSDSTDPSSTSDTSGSSSDPLLQALQAASSTSTTSSDGLSASLTPADRSKIMSISHGASGSATSSYHLVEQMLQREMQGMSFSAAPALSFSA
jgi:Ca2+-binding EF-hand superfamily protein